MSIPYHKLSETCDNRAGFMDARGYILLPVAIGITMIATIALLINMESINEANQVGAEFQTSQVQYIDEASYTHALWHIDNNICSGDSELQHALDNVGHYTAQLDTEASIVRHYTLPVVSDTYIEERDPEQVRGSQSEIHIGNDTDLERHGLFRFDLSAIPESENISEAIAWFYTTKHESDNTLAIHAVSKAWTEADATWNSMEDGIDPIPYAFVSPKEQGVWVSVNITGLAQYWANAENDNHGLLILAPEQGREFRFGARETNSSLRPRLEIITANASVSPVEISSTATLSGTPSPDNDISRSRTQSAKAYQSPVKLVLQPGPGEGKDVGLDEFKPARNYGATSWLEVSHGSGSSIHSLLQFALDIPDDAKIVSALLSLYQNSGPGQEAMLNVQRVTQHWEEGNGVGGNNASGASWLTRDDSRSWNSPGGDMDSRLYAATTIGSGVLSASWEISDLVQGWVDGSYPNYGLALTPGSADTDRRFESSDASDVTQRPKLTISYRCECGSPCRP